MTSASVTSIGSLEEPRRFFDREACAWLGILTVLFITVYSNYLERLFRIVTHAQGDNPFELIYTAFQNPWNPDWSHALIVPFISLYYIYQQRDRLAQRQPTICLWGLPLLFLGLFSYAFWIFPGRNDMFQGYSMILALFGMVLFLLGPGMMRVLWFPILFLVFSVKISDALWSHIAWRLQEFAAEAATFCLKFFTLIFDFEVNNRGATIDLSFVHQGIVVTDPLNVAEACSGLRSLMAFIALGTALAFLWKKSWWQRAIMILATVPIAIAVNVARVTIIGLIYLVNPEYAQGDFHIFVGLLMLIPAAGLFLLLGWVLDQIFIHEEHDDQPTSRPSATERQTQARSSHGALRDVDDAVERSGRVWITRGIVGGVVLTMLIGLASWAMRDVAEPNLLVGFLANPVGAVALAVGAWVLVYFRPRVANGMAVGCILALLIGCIYGLLLNVVAAAPLFEPLTGAAGIAVLIALIVALAVMVWRLGPALKRPYGSSMRAHYAMPVGVMAGILLASLSGQQAVIAATQAVLIKSPVPLQRPLVLIPAHMGHWMLVKDDPPLSADVLETLGTDKYISRIYRDTSWPVGKPGGVARLHIAYYTGTTDTVPHVPDRCFVAGGAKGMGIGTTTITLDGAHYRADTVHGGYLHPVQPKGNGEILPASRIPAMQFPATMFTYEVPHTDRIQNVVYFFAVNGKFLASPNQVRLHGFDPRDKYAYYCKVEVQLFGVADTVLAKKRASDLLSDMLPEIMACLPDWVQVRNGQWPPKQGAGNGG